ncbi:MAG: 16S rRNA (guanine(527)-N(7))-methyltransferase RsmG [Alphaproteobacteria bacterium]|nr:MAG: 16S rRNA (guanine(527)-N(7))-methyltransferase RsmG [Alphaproteobacteria bacterium]
MIEADRARAVALFGDRVSRETWARLDRLVERVIERQTVMNLVAASTIPHIWTRHVADSLQLLDLAPAAKRWIDLGSGAGFPGLVIAAALGAKGEVHLVESNQKKARFLREAARELALPAIVHASRIEDLVADKPFDVVTARALAPLDKLLGYANPLLKKGMVGLFPKGQDVGAELTQAAKSWKLDAELIPSKTDPHGRIVVVRQAIKYK